MDQSSFKVINYGTYFTMPLVWEVKLVQSIDEYASTNGMNSRLFDRRVRWPCLFKAKLHTVSGTRRVKNLLLEHSFAEDKDTNP